MSKAGVHRATTTQQLAVSSCQPCQTYTNGSSYEYIYRAGAVKTQRIVANGIAAPWVGLAFDSSGNLFVANCSTCLTGQSGVNNVVKIKPKQISPALTITNGLTYPYDLVLDSSNTLYVSNLGGYSPSSEGQVSEYASSYAGGAPTATIQVKYPLGLAVDSHGNLYVANCVVCSSGTTGSDQVLVYAPGQTSPSRTITTGINEPVALAVDSADNLYVSDCMNCSLGAAAYVSGTDNVTEYAYGGSSPVNTIALPSQPDVPFSLAVDNSNDLFVGNFAVNSVTEYPPGASTASRTITNGVSEPASLAIDSADEIFVSNAGANTVTGYNLLRNTNRPKTTLSVSYPSSIAVSP